LNNLHPSPLCLQSIKKLVPAVFVIFICSCLSAKAQYFNGDSDSKYGISIGTDYDTPLGNLAYTFKPAINYNLNLLKHSGDFTANISFGYHSYKPKMDTFYYAETNVDYGTAVYQNLTVISAYLGGTYDYPVTDQFKINAGINLGLYATHNVFHTSDFTTDDNEDISSKDVYLAARLGFTCMVTDNAGIGLEAKYNFFAPTGDADFNPLVGKTYFSWSAGVRLMYNF